MSRIFIKPSKDVSIYKTYPNLNTGYDEILEVGKKKDSFELTNGAVRSLIYFDLSDLQGAPTSSAIFLNLKLANENSLYQNELVYIYSVSQSWDEGSGYFQQRPYVSVDGASWNQYSSGSSWITTGSDFNLTPVVSASVADIINGELRMDVTDLVAPMISGSSLSDNFGLLLKFSDESEGFVDNVGNIKFFSRQTHTVHEPTLEFVWLNQIFSTGSLKSLPSFAVEIAPKNLKTTYSVGEISKLYFTVRDTYPPKTYTNTSRFDNRYYLPSSSVFSIEDAGSGTTIVPFDVYSHINCDSSGSYVLVDTRPLYKNRFYDLKIKVTLGDEIYFTKLHRFKIS